MRKVCKFLSIVLCATLLFSSVFTGGTLAETSKWRIIGDGVRMRSEPTTNSDEITSFAFGTLVTVNGSVEGQEVSSGNKIWYNVTYGDKIGYVYSKYIEEIKPSEYDADFEQNLLNFPESYREPLRSIHNIYPNWKFVADNLDISLEEAIDLEYSAEDIRKTRKWVELTYGAEWRDEGVQTDLNGEVIEEYILEACWTYASKKAISYFMDPRNALTVANAKSSFPNIFTFLQQSYDEVTHTAEELATLIKGTFLENGYDGDSDAYINDIMAAAEESGVSPYVIASTIITEQGTKGTSSLISGAYEGYEGYYNFFNYGAYGSDAIVNGLQYAMSQAWNSRRASIIGGAKKYESGYLGANQDTYYYMDFNVKCPDRIWHQYANSLYDQCLKATSMGKSYVKNTSSVLSFKIPVYTSMADTVYTAPFVDTHISIVGDVDADGDITNQDLILLFQYLSGWEVFDKVDIYATDIDGDDNTTNQDVIMLFQYLSGWDVIIGKNGLDEENEESNTGHSTETFINPNTGFMWPVTGCYTITTPFVPPSTGNHLGIDIGGLGIEGQPIRAIADGVVIAVQNSWTSEMGISGNMSYGNYCVVNHGYVEINGKSAQYVSLYAHAADIIVSEGETVKQGQVIGYVGTTGNSTAPHLHMGILKNGSWVNPHPLLCG